MSGYTVTIEGFPVECQDPRDVIRLLKVAKGEERETASAGKSSSALAGKPSSNGYTQREKKDQSDYEWVKTFLRTVKEGGELGASSDTLTKALKIKAARGLGGVMVVVKRILGENDFRYDDVFARRRLGKRHRWKAGPKLDEVLAKLEKKESGQGGNEKA